MMILRALLFLPATAGFVPSFQAQQPVAVAQPLPQQHPPSHSTSALFMAPRDNRDLEDQIDYNARRKAQGGAGEVAAGAVLGGMLLGPFGALFGAQMGAKMGEKNALGRARQGEMERMGISQDMLDSAQEIGFTLEQSVEGLEASRMSLETQQQFARRLDRDMTEALEKAKREITAGNEDEARKLLLEKKRLEDKLKATLQTCAEEKKRFSRMEQNIQSLEERAMEMESLLRRTVGAKTLESSSAMLQLDTEDPLLRKFRDMGID